ncbi:MAG: RNA polymerase sigma factor [Planctomycetales bacterium]
MAVDTPSVELLKRFRGGDQEAAADLFRRYLGRLTVLARSRLSRRIAQRVDPEDVVLSAYRSFFVRAHDGRVELTRSGDLWRLLVAITLHKLHRTVAHHQAQRRNVGQEQPGEAELENAARDGRLSMPPTAEEAVAVAELLERLLADLPPVQRKIVELRLQDHRLDEIAKAVQRSERTVRRLLRDMEQRWHRLLASSEHP